MQLQILLDLSVSFSKLYSFCFICYFILFTSLWILIDWVLLKKIFIYGCARASTVIQWSRIHLQFQRPGFGPWVGKISWRRAWQPTPVFLPGESPWTEELGGLWSMVLQRVRHDWVTKQSTAHKGRWVPQGPGISEKPYLPLGLKEQE